MRRGRGTGWEFVAASILAMTLVAGQARASGFAIVERSAEGLGEAFAGATAGYADGSSAFCNPAAMTVGDHTVISAGGHVIITSSKFRDEGSHYGNGTPLPPVNGGNGGMASVVPNLYAVVPLPANMAAGLAVNSPFGLASEWESNWVGRYNGVRSSLSSVNVNPSLAWRPASWLAVGAGFSAMRVDADLTSAINLAAIVDSFGASPPLPMGSVDGSSKMTGKDWAYGYDVGVVVFPCPDTRVGLNYRSRVATTLDGSVEFSGPVPILTSLRQKGLFRDGDASASVTLPESVSLGCVQRLSSQLELALELGWTRWSRFDELRVQFASGQPDAVTVENWEDTWNVALGMSYKAGERWTLRLGTAYDQTPIPDAEHRTPRIPDTDRIWATAGCGYQVAKNVTIDAGYAHLFMNDAATVATTSTHETLVGAFESSVDIVSLEGVLTF